MSFDGSVERDARRYRTFVGAFVAASIVLLAVIVAVLRDDGTVVPLGTVDLGGSADPGPEPTVAEGADGADGGTTPSTVASRPDAIDGAPAASVTASAGVPRSAADGLGQPALEPGEEIVIGSVVSETGAVSFPAVGAAMRSYVADLNERGGISGHPVRLILLDDGLDTNRSRQAFRQLAEDPDVLAVVGSFAPLGEPDGAALLEEAGVPMITASGLSPSTFGLEHSWFLTATLENYGRVACADALRRGQLRVALVYISSEQIEPIVSSYRDCIESHGGAVLEESVQLGQPDYTATALRIGSFDADVVFHEIAQSASVQLWQAMDRQGVVAANQLVPGSDIDLILDYGGPAGRDVTIQTNVLPPHIDSPEVRRMKAAVAKYQPGVDVTSLAVDKWIGGGLFEAAATAAGDDLTRARIQAEMGRITNFDGRGLMPAVSYSPSQHTTQGLFYFFDKTPDGWGPVGQPIGPA